MASPLHRLEVYDDVIQQLALCLFLAKHGGHLLAQVAHDEHVDLGSTHALDKLVNLQGIVRSRAVSW